MSFVTPEKKASKKSKNKAKAKQSRKDNKNVNYLDMYYYNK
jgi:hypothetical protein